MFGSDLLYEGSGTTPNSAPAKGATGTVTWSLRVVGGGANVSLPLNTRVDPNAPQGHHFNNAKASVGGVIDQQSVAVTSVAVPDLTLLKTINDKPVSLLACPAGSTVTYFPDL